MYGFRRDHPIAADGVLNIHVVAFDMKIEQALREFEELADENFDFGAKIGLLGLFGFAEGHRDVRLGEIAKNLACPKMGCRHAVRITLFKNEDASGFVGGMP